MHNNSSGGRLQRLRRPIAVCTLAAATFLITAAQEPIQPPPPPPAPEVPPLAVPLPVLYRAFFGHVEFLELEADKAQQRGENPHELRNYYRDLLGLTDANDSILKNQSAHALVTVRGIDQRIKTIIQTERAKFPKGEVRPGQTVPPPPAILAQLDQQKDDATLQGIAELRGLRGGEDFEKIDRYLQQEFARNFSGTPVLNNPPPTKPLSESTEEAAQ